MADWTTIPDVSLEPGKPIRSIDVLALRDNPVAIAEGAAGAPKVLAAALETGNNERDWVLSRMASAASGSIGTYAIRSQISTVPPWTSGSTVAGSTVSSGLTGTWRANGNPVAVSQAFTIDEVTRAIFAGVYFRIS